MLKLNSLRNSFTGFLFRPSNLANPEGLTYNLFIHLYYLDLNVSRFSLSC